MRRGRAQIHEWLAQQGAKRVDEALAARMHAEFPEVSETTLRRALRECGLPLDPLVEGVRQETPEDLERTLLALAAEYEQGDAVRRTQVRGLVLTARRHAELAARRKPKDEELLWLRTWLENPLVFPAWARLRRRACSGRGDAV